MSGGGLGGSKIWPGASAYSCAKATLYRLVEVVHAENFERGVDINCIAPGAVRTGMTDQALKHGESRLGPLYQEALGVEKSGGESPELAASIIATLLSPVGDGVSGRLLSAKWDRKHLASDENAKRVIEDQDLLRLRRIDDELFARVPRKV
jgi:3-oxoacyl-[acyl-carrier protein] reductase